MSTAPEAITLTRPADIPDARWQTMQNMATKVVTGHYPWCTDHEEGEGDPVTPNGYCRRTETGRVADVVVSTGSLSGAPMVSVHLSDAVDIEELSLDQAALLGQDIVHAAMIAMDSNANGATR